MTNVDKARARRLSVVQVPAELLPQRGLAVRCMYFLSARPNIPHLGTLLISVETGHIQVWSHHQSSGYITMFSAVHMAGDYVMSMTSDSQNEYLFTGKVISEKLLFYSLLLELVVDILVLFCNQLLVSTAEL